MTVCVYSPGEAPTVGARTRQEPQMSNRATSAYNLRYPVTGEVEPILRDLIAVLHGSMNLVVTNSAHGINEATGERSAVVGFRAADDDAARQIAEEALTRAGLSHDGRASLETGYGIHRRTVTPGTVTA